MADAKSGSGDVQHVVDADGNHSIGVTEDGVFVPFVTIDPVHFSDRVAAGKSPEAVAAFGAPEEEEG